jgi:hypothetical protein
MPLGVRRVELESHRERIEPIPPSPRRGTEVVRAASLP